LTHPAAGLSAIAVFWLACAGGGWTEEIQVPASAANDAPRPALAGDDVPPPSQKDDKARSPSQALEDELVCRYEKPTGSRMRIRVCRTQAQIKADEADKQRALDNARAISNQHSGSGG
jgi:hypothetical protein